MQDRAKADLADEIAAAIDWWRDAGVDGLFENAPRQWLATERPAEPTRRESSGEQRTVAPPQPAAPAVDRAAWPQDLAAFTAWWLSEPALDDGRTSGRVPPRGRQGAEFMVIVPDPERDDGERLLSGPQGRLLDAMLAAMGIAPEDAYLASALPRHMPMADWPALADKGFAALLCHHVRLVAPRRLIVLGGSILPLLGNDPTHSRAVLREFNQDGLTIPLLAGKSLAALLERPRWKAGLWQAWLDWTDGRENRE